MTRRRRVAATANRLLLSVACLVTLFPALWVIAASFSAGTSLYSGGLIPAKATLENYTRLVFAGAAAAWWRSARHAFVPAAVLALMGGAGLLVLRRCWARMSDSRWKKPLAAAAAAALLGGLLWLSSSFGDTDFLLWMKNSLVICIPASLITVALTTTMGYAFSRFRFIGRRFGLLVLILIQMFPAIMSIVALFRLLQILGLLDSRLGLVLLYGCGNIAFNAWLLKGYMDSIPRELEESAYIDGASYNRALLRIIIPLSTPMLLVVFLFNFIGYFQEYLLASIVIFSPNLRPLALGMRFFINGKYAQNWTGFSAAAVVASLPVLIIFFSVQRFIVEGLTKGAVKG